jgi:Leucine-rich repeat (LRR) protein
MPQQCEFIFGVNFGHLIAGIHLPLISSIINLFMQHKPSLPILLLSLLLLLTFMGRQLHAQTDQCPRIYREGEILRTDPAQSYQWYRNGELIPGATQQTYTPTGTSANYAVQVEGKASTPFAFELPQLVNLIGQAFDEHLRPVANAMITVGNQTTQSDAQGKFQLGPVSASTTILLRGEKAGHWTSQRRITPTGSQTHVQLMLRSQPFEHELSAERGGTISRGPFFLTLQPNGVLDANNQRYTGLVKIALNGGRPDDPNFGWMMPGGDFMAQDAQGRERILFSYGFLSAHLQTPDGQPLKLDPSIGAQLRFVMPPEMVNNAPDSMPLWHFDEAASIWKEEGVARREGAAYIGTVRHFSSWNCDVPTERATVRGRVVDCKGRPVEGRPIRVGQATATTDSVGLYRTFVPSGITFTVRSMNANERDTIAVGPLAAESEVTLPDLAINGSGLYGLGVIDTSKTLTIYSYGTRGRVEYSIDSGATYQTSNTFATHMDSTYQVLVKDSMDCPTKVNYVRLGRKSACELLDSAELEQANEYWSIEDALASNNAVYKLRLDSLAISQSADTIVYYFPCLQYLSYSNNRLTSLPESFATLTQLQWLYFDFNYLTSLPESFRNLTKLLGLSLRYNQLRTLPEFIGNLTQLRELNLGENGLTTLPESFGNLTQLQRLYCRSNELTSLPESIGNLTQLQILNLEYNHQLTALPESIGDLTQLQTLDLRSGKLTNFPESFWNLKQLRELDLSHNQRLNSLPESIGNLTQLQTLNLENTGLRSMPESIRNLTNLRSLNLYLNLISPAERERIRRALPNCEIRF